MIIDRFRKQLASLERRSNRGSFSPTAALRVAQGCGFTLPFGLASKKITRIANAVIQQDTGLLDAGIYGLAVGVRRRRQRLLPAQGRIEEVDRGNLEANNAHMVLERSFEHRISTAPKKSRGTEHPKIPSATFSSPKAHTIHEIASPKSEILGGSAGFKDFVSNRGRVSPLQSRFG